MRMFFFGFGWRGALGPVWKIIEKLFQMDEPSLDLIFKYALCFNGYEAYGGLEGLGEMANERCYLFHETGVWLGNARELRACLFFEQRRWRHFGYSPEGEHLKAVNSLFERIQELIGQGEFAPNDGPEVNIYGSPSVTVDGIGARLLRWIDDDGLRLVLALDATGQVVERRCPDSTVTPDDPSIFEAVRWLFEPTGKGEEQAKYQASNGRMVD